MLRPILYVLGLAASASASAALMDVTITGQVDQVFDGAPASIVIGTPIVITFRYDTDDLVDFSDEANSDYMPPVPITGLEGATLTHPYNFLHIQLGSYSLDGADDPDFGIQAPNHTLQPAYPYVSIHQGTILGPETYIPLAGGYFILLPEEYKFGDPGGIDPGQFYGLDANFEELLYVGSLSSVIETPAVPLPAAAPLLLSGLASLGWAARRRKRAVV